MFTTIEHFEEIWSQEMKFSQNVIDALTDESLDQAVADDHRTLGQMAWHIVTTIPVMATMLDLSLEGPDLNAPVPDSAADIGQAYKKVSETLLGTIKDGWDDTTMHQEDDLWGERWKRGKTLQILIAHEIHHRGQMTVLMRQAGLKVPNIYGPAKEAWDEYGAPPPEV
ncbi:MAG: DinB family protein [Candidatus Zixiibacteriota bacterium]|nr:MAG: DinB family protein [candidate division Zixibacteria bacterium]